MSQTILGTAPNQVPTNGDLGSIAFQDAVSVVLGRLSATSLSRGAPATKTAAFTLADTENWVICNGTGTIAVTLPTASAWVGREVTIKTIAAQAVDSSASNVVPLAGGSAGTTILTNTAGKWATLVSDGTNWIIMAAN